MKICLIGDYPPYKGGISHFNGLLYKAMKGNRHEVCVMSWKRKYPKVMYPGKGQATQDEKRSGGDIFFTLDTINPLTWLAAANFIIKNKFDAVVFHWWTPFMAVMFFTMAFFIKSFSAARIVAVCHNVLPHEKTSADVWLAGLFFSKVDSFLLHSKRELSDLEALKQNPEFKIGYHPIYDMFENRKTKKEDAKKALGISPSEQVILFFGYVREYKGLKDLIACLPRVLSKMSVRLLIAGEFWQDKQDYLDMIASLHLEKNTTIADRYIADSEVQNYFNACDVVVLPYRSGTQSGVVQTAFGFDKPVICTDVGGLGESVTDRVTGYVVPKDDTKPLADAIIEYFHEKKEAEFAQNIKKDKDRFSWKNYAALLEKCILQDF